MGRAIAKRATLRDSLIETIFVLGRAYGLTRAEQSEAVMGS
jgi:hypothetical protein